MWLFIDTNIYLDFYRLRSVGGLLESLESVKDKIFLPQQIRNEVIRNRVKAALTLINEDNKKLSLEVVPFPDLLTAVALDEKDPSFQKDWDDLRNKSKELKKKYQDVLAMTVIQVAKGIDPISKRLQSILDNYRPHNEEHLVKARLRKELGNPPGKSGDPLGDQLAWEQLISTVKDDEHIWIISRDSDYLVGRDDALNPYLYEEFSKQRRGQVFTFKDLASALSHYKANADANLILPPEEELDLAKKQQRDFAAKSKCNCLEGPSPVSQYENRFFTVRCQKCGVLLARQEDFLID